MTFNEAEFQRERDLAAAWAKAEDKVKQLELQIGELKDDLDAEKAELKRHCGCEFEIDHKQTAECAYHSNQRNNDLRLYSELHAIAERVYDKYGKESDWTEWRDLGNALALKTKSEFRIVPPCEKCGSSTGACICFAEKRNDE